MKNYFLGILTCALFYGISAKAVEIQFPLMTARDIFAACALSGLVSRNSGTPDFNVDTAWRYADAMMNKRSK